MKMRVTVEQPSLIDIEFDDRDGGTGNNGDKYKFTISTHAGQPFSLNGEEVDRLSLTVVGNWELAGFFEAIDAVKRLHYPES